MTTRLHSLRLCLLVLSLLASSAFAAEPDHWVGTWATADVERSNAKGDFAAVDMTYRQIVHVSLGGSMVRVEFSNRFGTDPLTIGAAHVALAGSGKGEIDLPTANALAFGGRPTVIIPAGAIVVSDPVALKLPALSDLVISIFLPAQKIAHVTQHGSAYQTNYMAPGNLVGEKSLPPVVPAAAPGSPAPAAPDPAVPGTRTFANWFFLKSVDVKAPASDGAVVAFGDSITDGTFSTANTNQRWPDLLARRLQADKKTAGLGVLNLGIGGNRILHDVTGPSALARFDSDVLSQAAVKYMIVLESINDIGHAYDTKKPFDVVTAADIIAGITQLIERAHMHGIKVFGATLTPYFSASDPKLSAGYSSAEGEAVRVAVNTWIRTSHAFDGVIDFETATQDKATGSFVAADDHGDHLHPNDAGMKAMADAIDLKLFTEK